MVSLGDAGIPLYLYAKAPFSGKVKRRLCPPLSLSEATKVAEALLLHASHLVEKNWPGQAILSAAPKLDHPAFTLHQKSKAWQTVIQNSGDLGERMAHDLQNGINKIGSAAVLGTDIPLITHEVLHQAHDALTSGRNVVGPSVDGGFYLLGLQQFPASLFDEIEWGSAHVFEKLMRNAKANNFNLTTLPMLSDCDVFADLQLAASVSSVFKDALITAGFDLALLA